jgi:hypothetical protein
MVDKKHFSAFTSGDTGRNSGDCAWFVRSVRPNPWIAASARQPALRRYWTRRRRFLAESYAARVRKEEDALFVIHKGLRIGEIRGGRPACALPEGAMR